MRKVFVVLLFVLLPVLACSQTRVDSPQTVEWDGESSSHEVGIQTALDDVIILGETTDLEYYIDLDALGYFGEYVIMVRGVEFTAPDMYDYSEWIRSDTEADVIMIDGVAQTFTMINKKLAVKPAMIRLK